MDKKLRAGILGGLLGFVIGVVGGSFLGLVVGGTFFGWLEFTRYPGLTGYELGSYIGGIIGILVATPWGVFFLT
jgi:hypothetical protein